MRKHIIISLLMVAVCANAQTTSQQWRDSVSVLIEAIRKNPQDIDLKLRKAEANINLSQWEYATEEYGNVLRQDDRNLAALYFRAFCHTQLRHYDMAKADYESFLAIQPQHLEAHLGLAHTLQKLGRKADTLDELNRTVQLFPDSADAYAARAAYETELKQYDVAVFDWDEAIRLRPGSTEFIVSKVDVLLRQGKRKDARDVLDETVKKGTPKGVLKQWYDQCK
ncbi:MAG: tetratricopeptide repeat protein [Prevotella sp.]|nr:tetratricopeptide repeat protein [Prevotella sp.]